MNNISAYHIDGEFRLIIIILQDRNISPIFCCMSIIKLINADIVKIVCIAFHLYAIQFLKFIFTDGFVFLFVWVNMIIRVYRNGIRHC